MIVDHEITVPRWVVVKSGSGPRAYVVVDRHTETICSPPMTAIQCRELAFTWNTRRVVPVSVSS